MKMSLANREKLNKNEIEAENEKKELSSKQNSEIIKDKLNKNTIETEEENVKTCPQADIEDIQELLKENSFEKSSTENEKNVLQGKKQIRFDDLLRDSKNITDCENAASSKEPSTSREECQLRPCNSCELLDPFESSEDPGCFRYFRKSKCFHKISEYWLISVPKEDQTFGTLHRITTRDKLSQNFKFHIPVFKVVTMNVLVSLIEQLQTLDNFVRDATAKLCEYIKGSLADKQDAVEENLTVQNLSPAIFVSRFAWNKAKYPIWHSISSISDQIYSSVDGISEALKRQVAKVDDLKSKIEQYEKRESDTLQHRYLGDIVREEHFVLDSRHLITLLVVVPNNKVKQWLQLYENLCDMVVPQSTSKLFEDSAHSLFNVTLCRKSVEEFKLNAKKKNFFIREYDYSEEKQISQNEYYKNLTFVKAKELAHVFWWAKINFSECFEAWIHVKALRVFVESVLRFGLPVNYEAILLLPLKSRKLKKALNKLYKDVDACLSRGHMDDVPGGLIAFDVEDYYPYVYFDINLEFLYA